MRDVEENVVKIIGNVSKIDMTTFSIIDISSDAFTIDSSTLDINSGAFTLDSSTLDINGSGAISVNSTGGAISIGEDTNTGAINIGTGSSARTITIGNAASTAVNIDASNITVTSVDALTLTDGTASFAMAGSCVTSVCGATSLHVDATVATAVSLYGVAVIVVY